MLEIVAALLSAVFLNVSPVLQSVDARASSASLHFRAGLLWYLARRRLWLAGTALGAAAVLLELYALTRLPLSLVQPMLGAGVLLMPLAARMLLDERLSAHWFAASALIVAGVLVLGLVLPVNPDRAIALWPPLLIVFAVAALALYMQSREVRNPAALALIAGVSYSASAVWLKVLAVSFGFERVLMLAPILAGFAAIGFLAEMSALRKSPATAVAPPILGLTTVLPVIAGHAFLHEAWPRPGLTLLGFVLTLCPALWIAAHFAVDDEGRAQRGKQELVPT